MDSSLIALDIELGLFSNYGVFNKAKFIFLTEIILWQILLNIDISRMINTVWKILRNKVLRNILGNKILGNEILGNRLTIFWKE